VKIDVKILYKENILSKFNLLEHKDNLFNDELSLNRNETSKSKNNGKGRIRGCKFKSSIG
jgi:hypothetical protein